MEVVPVLQDKTGCFKSAGATVGILNAQVLLFFQLFNNYNCRGEIRSPVNSVLLKSTLMQSTSFAGLIVEGQNESRARMAVF